MKKVVVFFVICNCISIVGLFAQGDSLRKDFHKANQCYKEKDYTQAIEIYNQLIDNGLQNHTLYYNLANAYFKNQQLGFAILNYERALRLSPDNEDIEHNLRFANAQRKDKMDELPTLFIKQWFLKVGNLLNLYQWSFALIISVFLICLSIAGWLLLHSQKGRIGAFWLSIVFLCSAVICLIFTILQHNHINDTTEAIVIAGNAVVKSTPDVAGTDLFIVHEGIKVRTLEITGDWTEVRFPNGEKGWLPNASIENVFVKKDK
ncbi:MAG: tetratricopeptide repeat protein [Bacteroidales bacterium]|nr:tetratricopeptide repeat protein [Bacteroidales bacterium]